MGKKYFSLRFFLRNLFLRRVLDQKLVFFPVFFCVLGIGVDSFWCYCKKPCIPWTLGLQYTGIQMSISWTLGLQSIAQKAPTSMVQVYQSPQERASARGFTPLYQQPTNKF